MNNSNKKYYSVHSLMLANAITFITGLKPMKFDDVNREDKKVFSFEKTEEIIEAMNILNEAKNKLRR